MISLEFFLEHLAVPDGAKAATGAVSDGAKAATDAVSEGAKKTTEAVKNLLNF